MREIPLCRNPLLLRRTLLGPLHAKTNRKPKTITNPLDGVKVSWVHSVLTFEGYATPADPDSRASSVTLSTIPHWNMERRVVIISVLAVVRAATAALVLGLIAIADLTLNFRSEGRFAKAVVLQANVHRLQQVTTWGIFNNNNNNWSE